MKAVKIFGWVGLLKDVLALARVSLSFTWSLVRNGDQLHIYQNLYVKSNIFWTCTP